MKKQLPILFLALSLLLQGCGSTPTTIAYKTEGTVVPTVDTAILMWRDYVATGQASQSQMDTVKSAYNDYFNSQQAAKGALEAYLAAQTPDNSNAVAQVTIAASKSAASLIALIQQFQTKGK